MQTNKQTNQDEITKEENVEGEEGTPETVSAQDLANVVEELKAKRKEARELKEKLEELESKKTEEPKTEEPVDELSSKIEEILSKRELKKQEELRKSNLENAIEKFKRENPQFNSSNDADGVNFSLIEKELKNFNISNASSVEDFSDIVRKAAKLAGVEGVKTSEKSLGTSTNVPVPGGVPTGVNATPDTVLTDAEKAMVRESNLTEERALELKKTRPLEFSQLLEK